MIKRFLHYYKKYKKLFIEDMIASFLVSITAMVYPIITRNMLNDFIPNKKYNFIVIFSICLFGIYVIRGLLRYFVQYYGHFMGVNIQSDMRKDLFKKIEKLDFTYFDNNQTGSIMSRLTNDLFDISELAHHGPEMLFMSLVMLVFAFVYLSGINLALTLIIFSASPFLICIAGFARKRHMMALSVM